MLQAQGICYRLTHKGQVRCNIEDVNLCLNPGEIVALVGKSGIGKTTIAKLLAGIIDPEKGNVICNGEPVVQPSSPVALAFQDYHNSIFPWLTVRRNLQLGESKRYGIIERDRYLTEVAGALGICDLLDTHPNTLSGGQAQRVQIGRALVSGSEYLILDEPTSSLDFKCKRDIDEILINLAKTKQIGTMLVTHDIEQAAWLSNRMYLLKSISANAFEVVSMDGFAHASDFVKAIKQEQFQQILSQVHNVIFGNN